MKKFLLYISFVLAAFTGFAQDGQRMQALKIAFITKKLDLSPEEAQRFWPVYNEYSADIRAYRQDAMRSGKPEIEIEENVLNIRKKYNAQFTRVLSPEKVNTFFRSEKEFGNFVQKEIERRQERMQDRRSNRP